MGRRSHLSEYKQAVLATMLMRLTEAQALAYLRGEGINISHSTLSRVKSEIRKNSLSRLYQVASYEFHEQHLARIDNCELIAKLMWQEYIQERSHHKRALILAQIKEIQPYLSSYYESTKDVLESKDGKGQDTRDLSQNRQGARIPPIE